MVYETSYESGLQPFIPDTKRGYWANPTDFIYAGIALSFRLDFFSMSWFFSSEFSEASLFPSYFITLAIYTIPLMVIQSFLGQFSSSSYLSALRITPLFKGIGYITLALNFCIIIYFSVFAMLPLVYMFASMQPTLPWSCEGFKRWAVNLTEEEETNLCNIKFENADDSSNETYSDYINHHIPSVLYFNKLLNGKYVFTEDTPEYEMAWQLVLCAILVWLIVAVIVYKCFTIEKISQLIRYSVWTFASLLAVSIVVFSFLPGAGSVYRKLFLPSWASCIFGLTMIPSFGLSGFGPGWGLIISLSSFNKFKTNIKKSSWLIGLGQMVIMMALSLLIHLTERFFKEKTNNNYYSAVERTMILYLSSGSVLVHMPWANLWSILFYFMLFLGAMILIIIQLFSLFTTIFDEFVTLRDRKTEVSMMITGVLALCSLYFTSNHGIIFFGVLSTDSNITQNALNLLLILIVLWIYGRVRFQRDIEFMIKERFSTTQIYSLRFLVPLFMVVALLTSIVISAFEHSIIVPGVTIFSIIFILLPWIFIPGYAIRSMHQGIGTIKQRFLHCCRPNDWYPVDAEDRQRYEEAMGNADITHQLNEVVEEVE